MEKPKQRPSGAWTVRVRTGRRLPSGVWEQVRVTAPTRRAVEELARKTHDRRKVIKKGDVDDVTLDDFVPRWLLWQESRGKSENTTATNASLMRTHWLPHLGRRRLSTITTADINTVVDKHPGALASVMRARGAMWSCMTHAESLGLINSNPVAKSWVPVGERNRRMQPPTTAHLVDAIARAQARYGPTAALAIRLAADTGARRGELGALRWDDVDLATGDVEISRSMTVRKTEKDTKTGSTKRLRVTPSTLAALVEHRARLGLLGDPVYVVADDPGVPWRVDRIGLMWARVADDIGVPDVHLHDIRHRFVVALIAGGMTVTDVAELAGHSRPTVTLDVYGKHVTSTAAARAAVIIGDLA